KWASIKHQKATTDARRSNLFTKLANNISVAARGGSDAEMNYSLRLAIEKAKSANMPKDNIERAIKRGSGELGGAQIENITYEIYGPSGSAILAEALTDNKNRTSADIKSVLNKLGGKLASGGAVSYLFQRKGIISVSLDGRGIGGWNANLHSEDVELKILDSGADDYLENENGFLIYTSADNLHEVCEKLEKSGLEIRSREIALEPKETVELEEEDSGKVIKLLEALDELDDITEVNSNLG
ncbi:MAG: YebC/PmpR family DNA-binding transcriptional regulator, partial [bacterium]